MLNVETPLSAMVKATYVYISYLVSSMTIKALLKKVLEIFERVSDVYQFILFLTFLILHTMKLNICLILYKPQQSISSSFMVISIKHIYTYIPGFTFGGKVN